MELTEGTDLKFWAIVELMGHQRMAGYLTTQSIGSAAMIRVDVPDTDAGSGFTRYVNPSAVYAINPCDEPTARLAAASFRPQPVQRWELPQLPGPDDQPAVMRPLGEDNDFDE